MEEFWTHYNRKTVVSITEGKSELTPEEKLRILRLFLDDMIDPDMYGLLVDYEIQRRVKNLRKKCWGTDADPSER